VPFFGGGGGGGAGATTFHQYAIFLQTAGPSSYPTGGFTLDLSATFSSLTFVAIAVKKGTRNNWGIGHEEITLNSPAVGQAKVKVLKHQQTRVSSWDSITGQPVGVTVQTTNNQAGTSEAAHTHDATHSHVAANTAGPTAGGGGNVLLALGQNMSTHVHSVTVPSLAVTTGAGTSHNHTDNNLYDHRHTITYDTAANVTEAELANATNLSTTTLLIMACGDRA